MGLFGKVPLDDDFDRALAGHANNSVRKCIARAQPFVRDILLPGETLRTVFYEGFTGTHTLVVTDQRLLVIRNSFGGGRPKELWLAAKPEEIRSIRHGGNGNAYGILIQVGSTTVATQASDHLSGRVLAESVQELCGMD
ncbi:hypothetical protein JCM4814A_83990 [Streptomyces phaeofaciens JCM 4814]|uniref:YokE-like PH domain-containing protein n=1 Tax=Streptomyces phaeofaciens TaxID=68254 RepID=A0A918HMP7_9ACTN|nr:hypothetical protein [Streptomyces phaeofaciens]GGT83426.1 hypothetical protein GCM10010226_72620 [Streptomyces phaeofaciens]